MAQARGLDLRFTATTERRRALEGADAVLSSFRPGGFEARHLDESIPLRHGVIGQETQGPGGFFMALRSIAVLREVCGRWRSSAGRPARQLHQPGQPRRPGDRRSQRDLGGLAVRGADLLPRASSLQASASTPT